MKQFLLIFTLLPSLSFALSYQTGDIIFQTSKSAQSIVIQKATHSPYSHMGMIVNKKGKLWVLEAIQPVKYTTFDTWVNRGVNRHYVVKRLNKGLNRQQQNALQINAEKYLAKPYDIYFEWNDEAIYCSEIVWKAYNDALGIQLAPLQKLKSFDLSDAQVKALMKQRYGQNIPLQETVIAPKAIFESKHLVTVK
ncbi:MAG: YiiX family permuted papain-like enzyme [Acinetobacter sp.]